MATTEVTAPRRLSFTPAFDGVRGIAILLVISYHLRIVAPTLYGHWLPKGGSLGVDIFFVLSGFLITSLLLREEATTGRVRFGEFYRRRALRLLPALYVFVAAEVVWAIIEGVPADLERSSVAAVILYYTNWKIVLANTFPPIAPGLAHLWSLAVEEQFYILWPILLVFFVSLRRRLATVVTLMGLAIAAVVVARAVLIRDTAPGLLYFRTDMRADALLVGALASQLWVRGLTVPKRVLVPAAWVALAFVVVCVARLPFQSRFLFDGGFTLFAIAVAVMLLATLQSPWPPNQILTLRPLRAVGRVAYGLYLWHYFVFLLVAQYAEHWNAALRVAIALPITAVVTVVSWRFVEQPFLRRKDRSVKARAGS